MSIESLMLDLGMDLDAPITPKFCLTIFCEGYTERMKYSKDMVEQMRYDIEQTIAKGRDYTVHIVKE